MNIYPWLSTNIVEWQKSVQANKVPHALLIHGSKGLGKIQLANIMAQTALCENLMDQGACEVCTSCRLIQVNNHLDLINIRAENSIIKVDQIRKLSQDVNLSTTRNQHKVVIIENAEDLNISSANALLKTLEEPPASTIIILTSSDSSRLLPTIKSRCFMINVINPNNDESLKWLKESNSKALNENIELSLTLTNNAPLLADEILKNEQIEIIKMMIEDLYLLKINKANILQVAKKWQDQDCLNKLSFVSNYLMIILQRKLNLISTDVFSEDFLFEYFQNHQNNNKNLIDFINTIHIIIKRLNTPLKKELLIEELLINWQNV